jgi:precorrin-6A/cobalt-precorrin-6A reductase
MPESEGRVLVLGGTIEARQLATALSEAGRRCIYSLAGRVERPRVPPGDVRIGGFGGPAGLAGWLLENRIIAVIDATHPFAERISASADWACERTDIPLLRLERPGWHARPDDDWHWVADVESAAAAATAIGERVFVTTGRQGLAAYAPYSEGWFLIRCVEPPDPPLPPRHALVLDRGPYTTEGELALLNEHRIDVIVTKDSGGSLTCAKLDAARRRGLPVVVVRRPPRAPSRVVCDAAAALAWLADIDVPATA